MNDILITTYEDYVSISKDDKKFLVSAELCINRDKFPLKDVADHIGVSFEDLVKVLKNTILHAFKATQNDK